MREVQDIFTHSVRLNFRALDLGISCNEQSDISIAYFNLTKNWLIEHNEVINFPEDCTVNPDLWKIYDLDKFLELYGPLNAKGWDEVWQKWEESKLSGEEDSKLSGEDEPGVSGEGEIERTASLSL